MFTRGKGLFERSFEQEYTPTSFHSQAVIGLEHSGMNSHFYRVSKPRIFPTANAVRVAKTDRNLRAGSAGSGRKRLGCDWGAIGVRDDPSAGGGRRPIKKRVAIVSALPATHPQSPDPHQRASSGL
jgi:hypothetical protein